MTWPWLNDLDHTGAAPSPWFSFPRSDYLTAAPWRAQRGEQHMKGVCILKIFDTCLLVPGQHLYHHIELNVYVSGSGEKMSQRSCQIAPAPQSPQAARAEQFHRQTSWAPLRKNKGIFVPGVKRRASRNPFSPWSFSRVSLCYHPHDLGYIPHTYP